MRPFHRNPNVGRAGDGGGTAPFLTEHLRDLDLELELLKRKREMIEKQQNLLNQQQAFNRESFNYDQPQSYRNHQPFDDGPQFSGSNRDFPGSSRDFSNSNIDFSQLYNEPQQSRTHFPRQSAKKRLGDYVWSDPPNKQAFGYEPPAKRPFTAPKKFGHGPKSKYVPPSERPGFSTPRSQRGKPKPSQRFNEGPQRPRPNDFKPTKVTKPNKPVYVQPSTNIPKHYSGPKVDEDAPILHPDRVPSQQTAGRLELALGNILKDVRDKYSSLPEYAHYFTEHSSTREMKQLIRERIRETMLGKPVGHITAIMKAYRDVYPVETDKEILEAGIKKKVKNFARQTAFNMYTAHINPYQFFKRNYTRLMSVSLNKIFERLEAIAKEESALLLKSENENKDKTETSNETVEAADNTANLSIEDSNKGAENSQHNAEISAEIIEISEDPAEISDNPVEITENEEQPTENVENPTESEQSKGDGNTETEEEREVAETIRKKYETMLEEMIPKKLALWLPRFKSQIMKVLANDITFERAKTAIVKETNIRLSMANEPIQPGSEISKLEEAIVNRKPHNLDYHVKIQGRPSLPKKSIMTEFLKEFNPKLVKKIKNVRNLLYVGFDNKNDFDRMVAANGTIVGNAKIIIKISQWVTSSALNASGENTSDPNTSTDFSNDVTVENVTEAKNDVLNDTLDNQIDELLTSIRKEEETDQVEGNNDAVPEANAEEKQDGAEVQDGGESQDVAEKQESEVLNNDGEEANAEEKQDGAEVQDGGESQDVAENQESAVSKENATEDVHLMETEQPAKEAAVVELNEGDNENGTEETQETNAEDQNGGSKDPETDEAKDKVEEVKPKETGKATPVRASTRLASAPSTPSSIRTRRASKLAQN